jgi:hypothetical protein
MDQTGSLKKLNFHWPRLAIPIAAVLCVFIAIRMDNSMQVTHGDRDFLPFWLAGHMVIRGENPYNTTLWASQYLQYETSIDVNPAFLYPLPLAILLTPLALLPFHPAYVTWVTLLQMMILTSLVILLSLEKNPRKKVFFVPILAGVALFRPTILSLTQGQVSGLFLFILAWIAFFWQKGKWFWGGFLLGFLALKPNLGVLVIGLLVIWLFLNKRWTAFFGNLLSGISILIAGLLYNPGWVTQYWQVGANKLAETFGGSPTVWGLGALISHNNSLWTLTLGGLATMFILLGFFWTILRFKATLGPVTALALAITVTLLITPYTWTYDQLLLVLPILSLIFSMDRMGVRFPLTAILFPGIDVLIIVLLFFDAMLQVEILNVVIPAGVFGLGLWYFSRRSPANAL